MRIGVWRRYGTQSPYDSEEPLAVPACLHWLSEGLPIGESPEWRELKVIEQENLIAVEHLDPVRGRELYGQCCTMGPTVRGWIFGA